MCRLSLIVAMSSNRVIGKDNALPWKLPADLQRFKQLTMGHALIIGRRTFEAIGRPLPGRRMIVLTRDPEFAAPGVEVAASVAQSLGMARGASDVFIGGGAEVFRQTLDLADRLYLTAIHAHVEGDTFFPPFDLNAWNVVSEEPHGIDERHSCAFTFLTYDRAA